MYEKPEIWKKYIMKLNKNLFKNFEKKILILLLLME